jgi:hypothetical protein
MVLLDQGEELPDLVRLGLTADGRRLSFSEILGCL